MAPILHIMRHGQGYHSIATNGHDIRDPHLTGLGQAQCRERQAAFDRHEQVGTQSLSRRITDDLQVELLLASPLRRALQTCLISMAPCVDRGLTIIALPMAEEASAAASDTGSPIEYLKAEFTSKVDFDHVQQGWFVHEGEYATDPVALRLRAAKLRRWIRDRPEKEVVLVAHGFFNHYLTGDVDEKGEQTTPWWKEAELRTYRFVEGDRPAWKDGENGDWAMIEETEASLKRLDGKPEGSTKRVNKPEERARGLEGYDAEHESEEK